ncbi:VTT domain-containing protein [Lysinibacillus telephonicus]|uniref:VTT domain-containing protein n=1 Tax=Lysinibacillus telephonicus TaxID=1714840 RepID=UPI00397B15B4
MDISELFELLRMLDSELYTYIKKYGMYIYLLLFLIVFGKTGFVVFTFLPGDSLVFASGTIAALDKLNVFFLFILFFIATTLADSNNYLIGRLVNKFSSKNIMKLIPQSAIEKASDFLIEYDKIALTFSRFIPLMRTLTPFVAGFTNHPYRNFVSYNSIGALIWTTVWLGTGFALGNLPWVENNLLFTLSLITVIMFIPTIYGFFTHLKKKNASITKSN